MPEAHKTFLQFFFGMEIEIIFVNPIVFLLVQNVETNFISEQFNIEFNISGANPIEKQSKLISQQPLELMQ